MAKKGNTLLGFLGLNSIIVDRSLPKNPSTHADFAEILSVKKPKPEVIKTVTGKHFERDFRRAPRDRKIMSI